MAKLNDTEIEDIVKQTLESADIFTFMSVIHINQKPHAFMIGPKHVTYAADHHGGMLGQETIEKIPCAYPNCKLPYDQHTKGDRVIFLQLKRNATTDEARNELLKINDAVGEGHFDGYSFVESEAGYRIR